MAADVLLGGLETPWGLVADASRPDSVLVAENARGGGAISRLDLNTVVLEPWSGAGSTLPYPESMAVDLHLRRLLVELRPGGDTSRIVEIPLDHPIFNMVYDIEEILQVPYVGNAYRGVTSECLGCFPEVRGIFDDEGRLMVVVNWNTDLGDAWEWAEDPYYPLEYSRYASEVAINTIVYAMSH